MDGEKVFIPKILLRGDKAEFFARVGQRPFKIVGQVEFTGTVDNQPFNFFKDGKFSLNGKLHEYPELAQGLKGGGSGLPYLQ